LAYQTFLLTGQSLRPEIFGLVFFSTLAAYNLYWMVCKFSNEKKDKSPLRFAGYSGYFILFLAGAIAVLDYLWQMPYYFPVIIIASALTFLYILPMITSLRFRQDRKTGFIKTLLLALTWSVYTVFIPALGILQDQWQKVMLVFLFRFFFLLMLCVIFDSRDVSIDKLGNLPSIGTDFSRRTLTYVMMVLLVVYAILVFQLNQLLHNQWLLFELLVTGALCLLLYLLSLRKRGYYFYYFWVDGMMLLSSLAVYLSVI
jgi:4-hydroxybenzoate polyprenyltransferase